MFKKIWKYIYFVFYGYWQIPKGGYCYKYVKNKTKNCIYYDFDPNRHYQINGYCHWLEMGDWDIEKTKILVNCKTGEKTRGDDMPIPVSLLWDRCKECGLKYRDKYSEGYNGN